MTREILESVRERRLNVTREAKTPSGLVSPGQERLF